MSYDTYHFFPISVWILAGRVGKSRPSLYTAIDKPVKGSEEHDGTMI